MEPIGPWVTSMQLCQLETKKCKCYQNPKHVKEIYTNQKVTLRWTSVNTCKFEIPGYRTVLLSMGPCCVECWRDCRPQWKPGDIGATTICGNPTSLTHWGWNQDIRMFCSGAKKYPSYKNYPDYRIIWMHNFWFVRHFAGTKMYNHILAKSSVRQFCSWEYSTNVMKPWSRTLVDTEKHLVQHLFCVQWSTTLGFSSGSWPSLFGWRPKARHHIISPKKCPEYIALICEIPKGSGF